MVLSKVIEKLIKFQLMFLSLSLCQFDFLRNKNRNNAILLIINNIYSSVNKKLCTASVFVIFPKSSIVLSMAYCLKLRNF
ncbi:MAG: hypothetical protein GAK29_04386 [Acinetobacter bereziniae]|uniref:Uncharacterized protein n=1 Tax=Acinetobacter bereziniae TaxID=106648 RepID=A0A833PBA6_ACIBZ|nr:MAG: hypothetical protein GAK29_04386 [Acinetobacter bereziniae]